VVRSVFCFNYGVHTHYALAGIRTRVPTRSILVPTVTKNSDASARANRHSYRIPLFWVQFRAHQSCSLSTDTTVVRSVSQQQSDHRIKKQSIVGLDILITLTLCKLARLLSGAEFCSSVEFEFRCLKPKPEHANALTVASPALGCYTDYVKIDM